MKNSTWWIIGGFIALIGGILALFNPFAASLAVTLIAGWSFLIMGIFAIMAIFKAGATSAKIWLGLFGLMNVAIGISLFNNPLAGVLTLTILVGILIFVSGFARIVWAFRVRGEGGFWGLLMSGIISVILAVLIFTGSAVETAGILGIFLGVELIFDAFGMFALSGMSKVEDKVGDSA